MTKYIFTDVEVPQEIIVGKLVEVSPLILKILYKRGYCTAKEMEDMLFGNLEWSISNFRMKDTDKAVRLLADAIENGSQIVIYHDYDVDGCSAAALCFEALGKIGGVVSTYVNDRAVDGYGICQNGIDHILQKFPGAQLVLTVDNGISANEAVQYAKEKGLAVVVTDHHIPGDILPDADAVIDPKRTDETYPFHELCGTGVAFKLMLALYDCMGEDITPVLNTIDIVALATVADVVPLVGENRDLVREGLRVMNSGRRPAFRIMKELLEVKEVNAHYTIAYQIAPMINSLSRMGGNVYLAVETLVSNNEELLRENVSRMIALNKRRREETSREEELALGMLDEKNLPNIIILKDDSFNEGMCGIVAGRLNSNYHRPAIILAPSKDGILKASCRSISEFNIKVCLDKVSHLLIGYGGHAKAAGFSISTENFDEFKSTIQAMAGDLSPDCFVFKRELDDVLDMEQATVELIQKLKMLEPFGEDFPPLMLGLRYDYDTVRFFGKENNHVKYWNREHNLTILEWRGADRERARQLRKKKRNKAIGTLELNEYNGQVSAQFKIACK